MLDELVFAGDSIATDNLGRLATEESLLYEQRALEIRDIAESMVGRVLELGVGEFGVYEILTYISSGVNFGIYRPSEMLLSEDVESIRMSLRAVEQRDRAMFCRFFVETARERGISLHEASFLPESARDSRFVYVRNSFADEAFDVLSEDFTDPRVSYAESFRDCVAQVMSEEAGYCLLPLEERAGVRLSTVTELIYRNELRICAVTPVFGFDGLADMKYAAVSRSYRLPKIGDGDDRYVELRLGAEAGGALSELLCTAEAYGMSVYRVNTLTFNSEGEDMTYFSVVLRDGGGDMCPLLTYLALFVPDHVVIGVYKNLE
ncbi:MAG: hypothetical protein IJX38_04350 [Clostridia bacterium]|nr:hypothetical protein [Clostridia bacterium]